MTDRIHIQHVLLSLQPGGLENGVVNVVNRLDSRRFRSSVCCLKQSGEFASRIRTSDVAVHAMGLAGGNDPRLPWRLAELFRSTATDIVHTRNAEAFFYGFLGAKLAGVRAIVHSEHGRTFDDRPIRFWLQRQFSRYTDAVFALSEQLKQDLVAKVGIPPGRIGVLYNGVDFDRFSGANRDEVRGELGLAPSDTVVGSVGRLVAVKNYGLLLRAASEMKIDDLKILLVGDGPERAALEAMAADLGLARQAIFVGHREDVGRLISAMDIFVLPSVSEGMSNTILEAMAAAIPVVVSNVGGNPEIVTDGVDGIVFESGDQGALRDALVRIQKDAGLRTRLAAAGRDRVMRSFSMDAMISRYEDIYQSVMREAGASI